MELSTLEDGEPSSDLPFRGSQLPTTHLQTISHSAKPARNGTRAVHWRSPEAIQALSTQVGSLQDQIKSQGKQITQLTALCKETNNLVGDKDQGGAQTKPGPLTGPTTPPTHTGGEAHTPATIRPGLKAPFQPSRGTGFDLEDEEEPRPPKKEPTGTPRRHLGSLTPFNAGSSVKRPKMDLPDPYKGDTRGRKATHRRLGSSHYWDHHQGQGNPPTTIQALTAKFKEAFADPNAKQLPLEKLRLSPKQPPPPSTSRSSAISWRNWTGTRRPTLRSSRGASIGRSRNCYQPRIVFPMNSRRFSASIKIDNIRRKNEENRPKKTPAKSPATVATTSTTTTQRVRLSEDPNYVTPEERDCRRASGLCVKCGQKGHGIKQCPNGWKATIKEVAKVAEDESGKE
ncbi:Retrotransposon-derived protein PEG10 [Rhizoctonia solani]|uniref:Retrotransposon-derived protein PEG10 n=1 Tax=Rhizoctonia solani TaxID=456999 RepID=A0A8H8NP62_9AGAM|nr:Retrotransposon-derived protein PEG10 [Rhizoctonia solani]QRW17329.1 Retrotransposon-derived protein PEG10 [Rhizoctonia solani]